MTPLQAEAWRRIQEQIQANPRIALLGKRDLVEFMEHEVETVRNEARAREAELRRTLHERFD